MAAFLFLIAGSVGISASMIQMTHMFTGFHGAVSHRRLQKLFPFGCESEKGDTVVFTSCTDLRKAVGMCVFELAAVLNRTARLRIGIPNRSIPRPHTDPARWRSVGVALEGPAVVHCSAWASSLRVASSGADLDPMYPSADKAQQFEVDQSLDWAFFGSLVDFPSSLRKISRGAVHR